MSMHGKIAIVTGGNRGLGRAIALHLARAGADVILTYRSHAEEADAVVKEITAGGRQGLAFRLDIAQPESLRAFAADVASALGRTWDTDRFDFLVSNAGVGVRSPVGQTSAETLDLLYQVHYRGVVLLIEALLPLIADGGKIINTSSGLARYTGPGYSAYASMKGAIEVYTRYLAAELGPRRITANVIAPGPTGTDFGGGYLRDDEEMRANLAATIAMGRVGEPDDIGAAVAALLAEGTEWITGQRIEASGGSRL